MPEIMISNLNVNFVPDFNPLYAVPIVAVIVCAFVVYAFGFKSPVQPPSFEGIDDDRKYKKRKAKDHSKNKIVQNGKVNGAPNKINNVTNKKKESAEKQPIPEKTVVEKPEKKVNKKSPQAEKKDVQEKKENTTNDDINDDGWVQSISKRGRKNRKKEECLDNQNINAKQIPKVAEIDKTDACQIDEIAQTVVKAQNDIQVNEVKPKRSSKQADVKREDKSLNMKTNKVSEIVAQETNVIYSNRCLNAEKKDKNLEKSKENEIAIEEGKHKAKKKKKKNHEIIQADKESIISQPEITEVLVEIQQNEEKTVDASINLPEVSDKKEKADLKPSNVAFDELADLYPKPLEPRKKKRVRKDH